jgi:hypothetical protein
MALSTGAKGCLVILAVAILLPLGFAAYIGISPWVQRTFGPRPTPVPTSTAKELAQEAERERQEAERERQEAAVSYQVVLTRAKFRAVVVSPAYRNMQAMRALGDRLRSDFNSEPLVIVAIFDNARAASMADRMLDSGGSLDPDSDRFYDQHYIGNYSKNTGTGHHAFTILVQGLSGPQTDIQY